MDTETTTESSAEMIYECMPPLWLMYPYISEFSIGWTVGYGYEYKKDLLSWLNTLDEKKRAEWEELFPPPSFWQNEYQSTGKHTTQWFIKGEVRFPLWSDSFESSKNGVFNLSELQNRVKSGQKYEYLFFLMKKKEEKANKEIKTDCFSRWYRSEFHVETETYWCVEQFLTAQKARIFEDHETLKAILSSETSEQLHTLGRSIKNFDKKVWNSVSYSILTNGNYQKFIQNHELMRFLLSSEEKIIAQASMNDKIWGIGLDEKHESATNPCLWTGKNFLGFSLIEIRSELRRICKNDHLIDWKRIHRKYLY